MSVVNQMLRDLDRRQAGEVNPVYTQHLHPVGARRYRPVIASVIVVVAVIAAAYGALQYTDRSLPAELSVDIADRALKTSTPIATVASIADASLAVEAEAEAAHVATFSDEVTQPGFMATSDDATSLPIGAAPSVTPPVPALASAQTSAGPSSPSPSAITSSHAAALPAPTPEVDRAEEAPATIATLAPQAADTSPMKIDVRPHVQPARNAESEFRRAAALINQGRSEDARLALNAVLELDARHEGARQTLAVLLIEARAMQEAESLLTEGLKLNPNQSNFAIVLARLHLDRGDNAGALEVLRKNGAGAVNNAEYRAFSAALLQRMDRHAEALDEYHAALTLAPNVGVWWVGLGLSYEATAQPHQANEAFSRARASSTLSADVAQFVERKLQTLH